jgi:branched-chain amino acid transport system permease protein
MIGFLQNLIDALSLGSLYALAALGIGLMFGVLRLINFAQGDFITLGAYALIAPVTDVTARMVIGAWPLPLMLLGTCAVVVVFVLLADLLLFRWLRHATPPTLMIASFAAGYIIENGILVVYGARPKAIDLWPALGRQIEIGALHVPKLQLVTIGVTLTLMIALTLFLKRTRFGVQMRAAAEDFKMARYLGVRANLVIGIAFSISGILAAAASLLYISQTGALSFSLGVPLMLFGLIATVIGGMGSLVGAVVGGFAVGFISSMLQAYLPEDLRSFRDAFVFAIVILILLFRPAGLIPTRAFIQRI